MPTDNSLSGSTSVSFTATAVGSTRANLSVTHLLAAALFSRTAGQLEAEHAGEKFSDFWEDTQSNVIACIFTTVAGLEAFANELFVDGAEVFPDVRHEVMVKLWELYEQKATLEKYDFAALLRGSVAPNRGLSPRQDVAALIKLRNALIHFKPEWTHQQLEHAKASTALLNRAVRSPFFPQTEPLFPRSWASHGSARWAVASTVSFLVEFEEATALERSRIAPFVERLREL